MDFERISSSFAFMGFQSMDCLMGQLSNPFESDRVLFSILNSFNSESNRATPLFLLTYNTNGLLNRMEKTQP